MNVQKLNECMEMLKKEMGDGLLASSIISTSDAKTIVTTEQLKSRPAAVYGITAVIQKSRSHGYPALGRYYYLDLAGSKGLLFIPFGEYQWGIAIDTRKAKLGLLLNMVLPKVMNAFEEAVIQN